jgi:hypothetical protein
MNELVKDNPQSGKFDAKLGFYCIKWQGFLEKDFNSFRITNYDI